MQKKSRSRQTAELLYNQIVVEKKLSPGEKLPNELELSQQLKVSRATLREALRDLTVQGVLEVHRGKGTFVSSKVDQIQDFGFSQLDRVKGQLKDLFELRALFEPQAAAWACRRATGEEMEEIQKRGAEVERCIRNGEDRTEADRAFHAAIVGAAHNEFMMRLLPIIDRAVETAIDSGEDQEVLAESTLRDHAQLLEFLEKRNESGARYAMAIHMQHAMDEMGLGQD